MFWPVAKEIYDLKDVSILALVAMLLSETEPSDQFR